jgi:hypothetical protein
MGLGDHTAKSRPGPEPGPRQAPRPTRKAPGQARGGVALCLAALFVITAAQAQIIPTGTPAADILLTKALAEQHIFLTCSALEPQTHQQILQNWQRDVTAASAALAAAKVPQDAVTAFTTAAMQENLLPAPDTPFEDIRQLCDSQPDWATRYAQMNYTILEFQLPQALR